MLSFLKALRRDERGVSAVEYAILAGVLLVVIIAGVNLLGADITALFGKVGTAMDAVNPPG